MLLGYDHKQIEFLVREDRLLGVLEPNHVNIQSKGEDEIKRALKCPIGTPTLKEMVKPGMKVSIITSDISRPCPSSVILPPIIDELNAAGIKDSDIVIVFALGSHRHHTEEEKMHLVGEPFYKRIECIDSDANDCIHLGKTKHGTDVDIFSRVVNSDFVICCGNIEYHYFAGYSGGAKAIMPGVSTPLAIQQNHSMMALPEARQGNILSPVRMDVEEVASMLGIDFIVNVVLDEHKEVIYAVCGDYIKAHRVGCKFLDSMYGIKIKEKADIVICTPGGFPKDSNMYQAQKALDNAKFAVKDGGIIIWLASCKEGFGSPVFEDWMLNKKPEERIEEIKKNFKLGGHKAAAISLVQQKARVILISDLPDDVVRKTSLEPCSSLEEAMKVADKEFGDNSKVIVMPYAGSTLPLND